MEQRQRDVQPSQGEQCDDGNDTTGDGCSSTCQIEACWTCINNSANNPDSSCTPAGAGTACGNPDATGCNAPDTCDGAGTCVDRYKAATTACGDPTDTECNNPDHCSGTDGACVNEVEPPTTTCGDAGGACTNQDYCDGTGGCTDNGYQAAGTPCPSDGNVCTDDQCDGTGACIHPDNTAPCDDGNPCTAPDTCGGGQCLSGAQVYGFTGFFPPVDNVPTLNVGKAGRTFPIKWQLPLCGGGYVSRLSAVVYNPLRFYRVACDSYAPQDTLADADTSGASGLHYDASGNQYIFTWQTSSSFVGKCYEVLVELDNGMTKAARFELTK
jgi:cysteine-rich repeat protein